MRITRSDLDRVQRIGSRVRDRQPIRDISDVSDDTACKGVQALAPQAPGRRFGTKRSPLSEYMSLHLSLKLTTNCGLLSRIKWDIYFYIYVFLVVHKDTAEYTTRSDKAELIRRSAPYVWISAKVVLLPSTFFLLDYEARYFQELTPFDAGPI